MSVSLQEKKGYYYAVFRVPDGNGGTKQKWVSTKLPVKRGNKREAQKIADEIAEKYIGPKIIAHPKMPFWKWIESWLEQKQTEVDIVTYEGYKSYYDLHIGPYFKANNISLTDLTAQDVQAYYNKKAQKPGKCKKGKLSGKSLHNHHIVINGALEDAATKRIIPYNVASMVSLPKKKKYVGKYYTKQQTKKLLEAIKGTNIEGVVYMTLFYGLRRSEVAGIKWSAVDLENNTFTIQSTIVRFSEVVEKDTTKNEASHRTYPISDDTKQLLINIRKEQEKMRELFGSEYIESGYVFTKKNGSALNPDYITRAFSKLLEKNDLPHIRYHDLRHTTASLLLSSGHDLKRVSEWLGHSDIGTTANIYGHLSFESKKETSSKMGDILSAAE